jgi:uncharacterized protein (UPF0332 family)
MTGTDFLPLANRLATSPSEAEWRTAIGRAYYAAFHVARQLLEELGFRVPKADRAHAYLSMRLNNCGDTPMQQAAADLHSLRSLRNQADYDLQRPIRQTVALAQTQIVQQIIQTLTAARQEPIRTPITDAMRNYERDVLGDVTWQGP